MKFFDDDELMEDLIDTEPEFDYQYFVDDVGQLAKYYIKLFFQDKLRNGEPIPFSELFQEKYIKIVLNHDINSGMSVIYKMLNSVPSKDERYAVQRHGMLPSDVRYVISLLSQCAKAGVAQEFSVGIIIMYLELCEGKNLAAA